jgi:hypothetical protein
MAKTKGIPEGKKRYSLTLTETTMNRMHAYLSKNHAPKSMLSTMVDELILDVLKTFDELEAAQQKKGSSIGSGELFSVIGKIMTEKENEQRSLL